MRPLEGISKKMTDCWGFLFEDLKTLKHFPSHLRNAITLEITWVFSNSFGKKSFFSPSLKKNKILKQKPTHWHHITLNVWDLFGEKKPNDTFKACRFCRCSTSASWHRWSWKADLRSWWSLVVGEKTRGFSSSFEGFFKKHRHVQVGN